MGQINMMIMGVNILLLSSIFSILFYTMDVLKKARDKFKSKLRAKKNEQLKICFIFIMFVFTLISYLISLLSFEGLFGTIRTMPLFLILGAFSYALFSYFHNTKEEM